MIKKGGRMNYLTGTVMSSNLISISEDRDIDTADSLMKINKIRHLPVVNSNNELSGILSIKDIVGAKDRRKPIKSIMTAPVRVVNKNANIKSVIELMLKYKICSVLVANKEDIVGIITTDDLLKLLSDVIEDTESIENMDVSTYFEDAWTSHI